jgi:hypothetical protein
MLQHPSLGRVGRRKDSLFMGEDQVWFATSWSKLDFFFFYHEKIWMRILLYQKFLFLYTICIQVFLQSEFVCISFHKVKSETSFQVIWICYYMACLSFVVASLHQNVHLRVAGFIILLNIKKYHLLST